MLYDSDERSEYMSAASAASLLNERGYANVYVLSSTWFSKFRVFSFCAESLER